MKQAAIRRALHLRPRDHIVTAFAQPIGRSVWRNLWVIIRDADGRLREECLQPSDCSLAPEIITLYNISAVVHQEMLAALNSAIQTKGERR